MAELKVQVQVVKDTALRDIQSIEQRLSALEKDPVQIKFQVAGIDGAAQQIERLAVAQSRVAASASSASASSANFASSQRTASAAANDGAKSINTLETAYNRLGVTVANFAKYKAFEAITSGIRGSITEMRNLDDELVTVRKVADATQAELDKIAERSYEVGSKYGKAPSNYAAGVAEFSRAGYRETAESLAELSIKSQLVGDMSAQTANQFLLATDAAYGYGGSIKELSAVLDGMNAIDNNFATSIEKISAGLGKVAPIASQANVGVDELTAALGTITAVTQRSGEEAATALRALFLNIIGDTKTEIEDGATWTAGEIDGLRVILERYAPAAVAAAEATQSVINPMEAMRGLAEALADGTLKEAELMQMVTDIGGKLRSSQLLAIVQNWDVYERMLSTYQNAAGSADAEISKMMDSWSFKAQQLETFFTKMLSGLADSKDAKNALDFLRGVVETLDTDFGRAVISAAAFGAAMTGVATSAKRLISLLSAPTPIGWIGIAAAGISLLYTGINELFPSYDKLADRAKESQSEYEAEKVKLAQVNSELQTTNERINELQSKGSLTLLEQEELDRLIAARGELEQIQGIQAEITKDAQMQAAQAAAKAAEALGRYNQEAIQNEKEMFDNYGLLYGDRTPQDDLFDPKNINSMVAAFESLTESKSEALLSGEDVTEFNDGLQKIKSSLVSTGDSYQYWIEQMEDYYESIKDLPESALSDADKLVKQMYNEAQNNLGLIQKTLAPETSQSYVKRLESEYKELQKIANAMEFGTPERESAKNAYLDKYKELIKYNEALEEAQTLLDGITDRESAFDLAESFGLNEEATNALYLEIVKLAGITGELAAAKEALANSANGNVSGTPSDGDGTPSPESYRSLSEAIDNTMEQYNALRQAMHETNETGLISEDTFKRLEDAGVKLSDVYKDDVTGGFKVVGDELKNTLETTEERVNDLTGSQFDFDTEGLSEFDRILKEAMNDLSELDRMLSEMGESGDAFREFQDVYGDAMGLFSEGRTGTNAFAAYIQALFNDDVLADIGNSAEKAGEYLNNSLIQGMLDNNKSGAELAEFMFENFEGSGAIFEDLGDEIRTTITDWEAFSQSTGLAIPVLQSLFGYIAEYSGTMQEFGNTSEKAAQDVEHMREAVEDAKESAEEPADIQMDSEGAQETIQELQTTLQDVKAEIDEIINGEYSIEFTTNADEIRNDVDKLREAVEDAKDALDGIGKSAKAVGKVDLKDIGKDAKSARKDVDKLSDAVEDLRGATKKSFELEVDTDEAKDNIQEVQAKTDDLITADHNVKFTTNASDVYTEVKALHNEAEATAGTYEIKFKITVEGSIPSGFAEGTKNAPEGPAIVNEEGPELIVSRGRAYIAGDGRPTMVDLHAGDIVYTHEETQDIIRGRGIDELGIDAFASGTPSFMGSAAKEATDTLKKLNKTTTTTPKKSSGKKSSGGGGGGGGGGGDDDEDTDWWAVVQDWFGYYSDRQQRAIDRLDYQIELLENDLEDLTAPLEKQIDQIERLNDQLDRQMELLERQQESLVKPIQDEIDALEKAKDIQDEQLELAEKQKAVEEARNELQNAQNERTIRYFNEQKGQWEWMADKGAVADAQEALEEAEKDLSDFEYEMHIRDLERQIEQIEEVYETKIGELEEQQTANDDLIYDLEQQILAAEDAYNAAIEPLEKKMTELERKLKEFEEKWAEIELPFEEPEDSLGEAISNLEASSSEKSAIRDLLNSLSSTASSNLSSVAKPSAQTVTVLPTVPTQTQYDSLFAEMGLLFGGGGYASDTSSYSTSNVNTVYDYSGAISIGEITVTGDPSQITLADLIDDVGIYVQR